MLYVRYACVYFRCTKVFLARFERMRYTCLTSDYNHRKKAFSNPTESLSNFPSSNMLISNDELNASTACFECVIKLETLTVPRFVTRGHYNPGGEISWKQSDL